MKQFEPLNLTFFEHTGRILRHWFTPSWRLKTLLSHDELETIAQQIEDSETQHTAEIAIALETRLPWSYIARRSPSRERAWSVFSKMQVWDTPDNNGVLMYFLLAERRIELLADRSCAQVIPPEQWKNWVHTLHVAMNNDDLASGMKIVIDDLTQALIKHFPQVETNQKNRVSNRPQIL